jgi:hypothetical protein
MAANMSTIVQTPEFLWSFGVFLAGCGLAGAMAYKESRPRESLTPSMIPTTPVMLAGVVVAILALVHVLNLVGIHTGR